MREREQKHVGRRLLSLLMAIALVITSLAVSPKTAKAADGVVNITLHYYNEYSWTTPALQYWGGTETIVTGAANTDQLIPGWSGAAGQLLTQEGDTDFWSVTLTGDFTGLQFLDFNDSNKNSAGIGHVLAMNYCTDETPTDLYCKGSEPDEWYLDRTFTTSINTLIPAEEEEKVDPATWTGDFTGLKFTDPAAGITNWTPADANGDLNYVGDGVYARTFHFEEITEDATIQYKVAFKHGWSNGEFGDGGSNVSLVVPAGAIAITIVCDTQNKKLYSGICQKPGDEEKTVSLIGTIRGLGADDWKADYTGTEFDFTQFTENTYVYQMNVKQGSWKYKIIRNPGNEWYGGSDKALDITAADGKLVTFVYDAENKALYDSVNDLDKVNELLAEKVKEEPIVDGVKDNANGTTTFTVAAESGHKVELVYGSRKDIENNTASAIKTIVLSPVSKDSNGYTTGELFLGDDALDILYYYAVDDTPKEITEGGVTVGEKKYLEYTREDFTGRLITVPGTLVDNGGAKTWDPSINITNYIGNGLYEFTFHNVAPANYEYKIATGSWSENYGKGGVKDGANIAVTVPKEQDVTVWYSDFSHYSKCSLNYTFGASLELTGTGIPENTKFSDSRLTGVYSAVVPNMATGTYSDTKIKLADGTTIAFPKYEVATQKDVTFYYDPESGVYYSDASDATVDVSKVRFDSKDETMKAPFGAAATGENVTYTIETGAEVTDVRLIVKGAAKKNIEMTKKDGAGEGKQLWTATTSFDKLGEYKYFFAVYNGTAAVMYGDDDGYYGEGKAANLLDLLPYDQIVYQSGYKTPDWMKNAVVYQIFPDRFCDGDTSNDTITTDARGNVKYEYMKDWYILPENPEQETEDRIDTYPTYAYKGDGNWSNEIYGGDLKGITERIDYLKALGVTVIYMNPVFESISSHRYDTSDYKNIDPILGTLGDFEELVKAADENGMKIILDGVFNHVSDDSVYFDRYYEYLEAGTDTIGAYPYWAYVYDYVADHKVEKSVAENAAKEYFTKNYGITNFEYTEWFDVFDTTLKDDAGKEVCDTYGLRAGKPVYGYDGWWGYDSMPIIKATNGSEYQTGTWADRVIGKNETSTTSDDSVTQYWLSKGMDGWRLDVANEVSDETWQHFRKSVKALNSDNVIIGEIWTDAVQYLMGDMYDSVMNYMFRGAVIDFVKNGDSITAINTLERLKERYPKEAFYAMMNLVDSHDTTRILSYLDGIDDDRNQKDVASAFPTYENTSDKAKQMQYLVALMQFTYAGAPTIYYGDELGMVGADDPDDRRAMIWGKGNKELVEWYAKLAAIRSQYPALRTGDVEPVSAVDDNATGDDIGQPSKKLLSYVRSDDSGKLLVMMNNSGEAVTSTVSMNDTGITADEVTDVISGTKYTVTDDGSATITVPAYRGVILVASDNVKAAEVNTEALKPGYDPAYIVPTRTSESGGSFGGGSTIPVEPSKPDDTTVTQNPDGTTTETKTETVKNDAGKEVSVTVTTDKDTSGNVTGSKEVSVIADADKNTSVTVTVQKDAAGSITSAKAVVTAKGTGSEKSITGKISGDVVSQISEAAGAKDVSVSVTVSNGKKSYTVKADADELTAGAKLKVVAIDKKTKKYVLVNAKTYTVNKAGDVKVALASGSTYELVTPKEAAKIEKTILNTVKTAKSSASVKKGKTTTVKLSSKLDMNNVSKIEYVSSKNAIATVSKTGKVKAKKKGTVTVKVKVTLKNGKTKTVTTKIKVK